MKKSANGVNITTIGPSDAVLVDIIFDLCDAEFNSRQDVHESFKRARGAKSWARHYLMHEVMKVAVRHEYRCTYHMSHMIASALSEVWFEQAETESSYDSSVSV